jgi:hypothetical protein
MVLSLLGCEHGCETTDMVLAREAREAWHAPCADTAVLLATTGGSPNDVRCSNKRHRMRVTPAAVSGEEVGALVACECQPWSK